MKQKRVTPSIVRVRKAIALLEKIGLQVTPGAFVWQRDQWYKWSQRAHARKEPMPKIKPIEAEQANGRRHH